MAKRDKRLSLGSKGLIGLGAGLGAGAAIASAGVPALMAAGAAVELAGRLWINAILMTIVPLVFSKLFVSIASSSDPRQLNAAGRRALAAFILLLVSTATVAAFLVPAVFAGLPISAETAASLRAGASAGDAVPPKTADMILAMVPSNAIRAASETAMVPLVMFAGLFALGATRIAEQQRQTLVAFFEAIDAAIARLLGWIVELSPYGVFGLAVGLAMKAGAGVVTALGYYVVAASALIVICTAALYVLVAVMTRISLRRFAQACAPAQVVAFSTHSSAASLPAMVEGTMRLGLPQSASGFVLPLSLALFKYSSPVWFIAATFFAARLYGVTVDPAHTASLIVMAVVTSFAVGGVPSGAAVVVGSVLLTAGVPIEAMGLLLAVDPIPNAFRTVANVTGMLAVSALSCAPDSSPAAVPGRTADPISHGVEGSTPDSSNSV